MTTSKLKCFPVNTQKLFPLSFTTWLFNLTWSSLQHDYINTGRRTKRKIATVPNRHPPENPINRTECPQSFIIPAFQPRRSQSAAPPRKVHLADKALSARRSRRGGAAISPKSAGAGLPTRGQSKYWRGRERAPRVRARRARESKRYR